MCTLEDTSPPARISRITERRMAQNVTRARRDRALCSFVWVVVRRHRDSAAGRATTQNRRLCLALPRDARLSHRLRFEDHRQILLRQQA